MRGAPISPRRLSAFPASPARGGSTTTTSGSPLRSCSSSSDWATLPAKKAAFVIPFRSAFSSAQAAELLLDRLLAPKQGRRQVRHLGDRLVLRPVDRPHLGEAAEDVDEMAGVEPLAGGGDELDEHLPRVPALAHHQVAE